MDSIKSKQGKFSRQFCDSQSVKEDDVRGDGERWTVEVTVVQKLNQGGSRHQAVIDGGRLFWLLFFRKKSNS